MYLDTQEIKDYVLQLWAQAMIIYRTKNYSLVLDKENETILERLHKEARVYNPNVDLIQDLIDNTTAKYIGVNSIYTELFNDGVKKVCPKNERNEIKAILNSDVKGVRPVHNPVRTPYGFKERGWEIIREDKKEEFRQMSLKDSEELEKNFKKTDRSD